MIEPPQNDWQQLLIPSERARMLGDIARVSLAVGVRLFPNAPLFDLDVSNESLAAHKSPVERLAFIERALPLLTQAAAQIGRAPLTVALSRARQATPPVRARRVGTAALLQAVRRGSALRSLEETITTVSGDTPENRAVKSFLGVLMRDSAAIAQIADAEDETGAAERARRCRIILHGLLASFWWEEVGLDGAAWTVPATHRAAARPDYARVFRARDRYRAAFGFDWNHPWLTLAARETWKLYETWCLFSVVEVLCALGYVPRIEAEAGTYALFAIRDGRLTWTLAADTASRLVLCSAGGGTLSVTYNQTFAEGRHSLSHTMRPDITLASSDKMWVLDAKFKPYALPGEEGDDINQMHAYRDAVTDGSGRRVVTCAWCLYAGQADTPNRAQITYGRTEETAVGALCLRPGDAETLIRLRALLSGWLPEARPRPAPPASPQT